MHSTVQPQYLLCLYEIRTSSKTVLLDKLITIPGLHILVGKATRCYIIYVLDIIEAINYKILG